jgi:hypothetical protein
MANLFILGYFRETTTLDGGRWISGSGANTSKVESELRIHLPMCLFIVRLIVITCCGLRRLPAVFIYNFIDVRVMDGPIGKLFFAVYYPTSLGAEVFTMTSNLDLLTLCDF